MLVGSAGPDLVGCQMLTQVVTASSLLGRAEFQSSYLGSLRDPGPGGSPWWAKPYSKEAGCRILGCLPTGRGLPLGSCGGLGGGIQDFSG